MDNIKVLMIDDSVELVNQVKEYFSDHANINVCLEAYDGELGLKLIKEYQSDYDVVVVTSFRVLPVKLTELGFTVTQSLPALPVPSMKQSPL